MKKLTMLVFLGCMVLLTGSCGLISPRTYELEIRNNTNTTFTDIKLYTFDSDEIVSFPDVPYNSIRIEEMHYRDVKSYEVSYMLRGVLGELKLSRDIFASYEVGMNGKDSYPIKFIVEIPEGVEDGTDIIVTKVYGKH